MPRFLKRRKGIARSSAEQAAPGARAEDGPVTIASDEVERIEQEILAAESAWQARQRRTARRCLPWMTPLFTAGLLCIVFLLFAAAKGNAAGALVMGIVSVVANGIAAYAIRKGAIVAPDRFPVAWHSNVGRANGANYALGLAAFGAVVASMAIASRYL
ncbi:hypothetical protein [Micromonospora sp. SL4-19]|uniref:hypothetical protein n=1 Tax=Micromonospora sp. SL4-19 TaxID=3399129 RepID=UPI003A4D46B6